MPNPARYTRLSNFQRDANNGLPSPEAAKVDAELNSIQVALEQVRTRLIGITSADGRLKNVAQAIAQSLVGTWAGNSDGTAILLTTIPWDSTMSVNSILVLQGSALLRPSQINMIEDNGGFLQITLAVSPAAATAMVAWAFEPGAGLLTRLASTANGDGASLIGIEDAGGLYNADDVEEALAEIAGAFIALQTALGDLAEYFKRDGSVTATGDFDMGGVAKVINALDGVDPGDYVTLRQISTYVAAWVDLQKFYLKRDGTNAMAGNLNFGNNKGQNLADPDLAQPLDAVNVRSLLKSIATSGAAPVGTVVDYAGEEAPTNWLFCDGSAYANTAFPTLSDLLGSPYKSGFAQGVIVPSLPSLISGNLTAGAINGTYILPPGLGAGFTGLPLILVANTDGGAAVTGQPTVTGSISVLTTDGPNVTGGALTLTVSGGSGIRAGARVYLVPTLYTGPGTTSGVSVLSALPAGYFRVPDLRGRMTVGAGTLSKSPGITDPPDITKGDGYNATPRTLGAFGGEEQHQLTVAELAAHFHAINTTQRDGASSQPGNGGSNNAGTWTGTGTSFGVRNAGGDLAHNTMAPFHVLNKIVKAA